MEERLDLPLMLSRPAALPFSCRQEQLRRMGAARRQAEEEERRFRQLAEADPFNPEVQVGGTAGTAGSDGWCHLLHHPPRSLPNLATPSRHSQPAAARAQLHSCTLAAQARSFCCRPPCRSGG